MQDDARSAATAVSPRARRIAERNATTAYAVPVDAFAPIGPSTLIAALTFASSIRSHGSNMYGSSSSRSSVTPGSGGVSSDSRARMSSRLGRSGFNVASRIMVMACAGRCSRTAATTARRLVSSAHPPTARGSSHSASQS